MDLTTLNLNELRALQRQLQHELARRSVQENAQAWTQAKAQIAAIANQVGVPLHDLLAHGPKNRDRKVVPIRYRHPDNPHWQWTGRGSPPAWVVVWEVEHGSRDGITLPRNSIDEVRR